MGGTACRPTIGWKNSKKSDSGAIIPFRSNLLYQKLLKITRSTPRLRAPQAEQAMPAKFLFFFNGRAIFLLRNHFAGIASVLTHRRSRSHPIPPSAGSRRAKIPSPRPPSFLPACWRGRFLAAAGLFFSVSEFLDDVLEGNIFLSE